MLARQRQGAHKQTGSFASASVGKFSVKPKPEQAVGLPFTGGGARRLTKQKVSRVKYHKTQAHKKQQSHACLASRMNVAHHTQRSGEEDFVQVPFLSRRNVERDIRVSPAEIIEI